MRYIFRLPDVGEGIHEAEIVSYEVKIGDLVQADQTIVKIETDKAVVTLPAPATGKVLEIPHKPGDTVHVGEPLIIIDTEKELVADAIEKVAEQKIMPAISVEASGPPVTIKKVKVFEEKSGTQKRVLATPHTRHLARELGVAIETITGTGSRGRVTDDDVRRAVKEAPSAPPKIPRAAAVSHEPSTLGFDFEKYGSTRREPLKGVRKRIAEVMVRSYSTIPHVSHTDEADVTDLFEVIKRQKPLAEQQGVKLTITAFITKAVVSALQAFPDVNTSLDEESGDIVYKDYYHIGIATDTEQGLMVPVIKDADKKSILQIAKDIQDLAARARNREIDLEDLRGGTFSITNPGGIGGIHATPIIQHPQVAILGVLAARKKPVVKDDQIVIRTM
ncbi:2-oxo acid dehydrogenase subunit E2, partial [candidate division KSB1 bacterium]|nr:2-oxo acid dehydrogenase subunit E2 [candidate division KSB1 bacterium]